MQKVSYTGDGSTTEFAFNFPYYEDTNIIVTKNNQTATGYSIIGTSGGLDADIPYTGGKVVFDTAPTILETITISRYLPRTRSVDYQPLAKIDPTTLNQDINYLMEVLKDFNDELETFSTQYAEIVDKESTTNLLTKIATVSESITNVTAQITALGDISTLRQNVTNNAENITNLKDAANFTNTGKSTIAHLAALGSQYTDLTLGASGTAYTMPADGYLIISGTTDNANQYFSIGGICSLFVSRPNVGYLAAYVPVAKGNTIHVYYSVATVSTFRFVYLNGAD